MLLLIGLLLTILLPIFATSKKIISTGIMEERPFTFGVAASGDNFTDREKETSRLLLNFKNGINTILISPRRWGKTSLVRKVCQLAESEKLRIVYLDIFSCRSEREFYNMFSEAVIKQTSSKWEEWIENAKLFLSRISPKFSFGTDSMTDFSMSFDIDTKNDDVTEILNLPERIGEKKKCRIVVCIDEFQQIAEFDDSKTFQKRLRSMWQLQKSTSYCLFGSKKHLMNELFEEKSLPFYKFGEPISVELAERICLWVRNHSSYVQQLAWLTWIHTKEEATEQDFNDACNDILDQNTPLFEKQTENLTAYQLNFIKAMLDGVHKGFTTQEVLQKYRLGSSANVSGIKRALTDKELIETEGQETFLQDPVMEIWLKKELSR